MLDTVEVGQRVKFRENTGEYVTGVVDETNRMGTVAYIQWDDGDYTSHVPAFHLEEALE